MSRILLVHWDPEQAAARSAGVRRAGFEVGLLDPEPDQRAMAAVVRRPPGAQAVDISRAPGRGRFRFARRRDA